MAMTPKERKAYDKRYRANMPKGQRSRHKKAAIDKLRKKEYHAPEIYADRILAGINEDDFHEYPNET